MKVFNNPYKLKLISIDDGVEYSLEEYCQKYLNLIDTDLLLIFEYGDYYYILDECGNYDLLSNEHFKIEEM